MHAILMSIGRESVDPALPESGASFLPLARLQPDVLRPTQAQAHPPSTPFWRVHALLNARTPSKHTPLWRILVCVCVCRCLGCCSLSVCVCVCDLLICLRSPYVHRPTIRWLSPARIWSFSPAPCSLSIRRSATFSAKFDAMHAARHATALRYANYTYTHTHTHTCISICIYMYCIYPWPTALRSSLRSSTRRMLPDMSLPSGMLATHTYAHIYMISTGRRLRRPLGSRRRLPPQST